MTEPPGWSSPAQGSWSSPHADPAPSPPPGWGAPQQPAAGWGPGWGRPPEVRPGVVPLRPLVIGEIIDGAISTMRRHWKLQLGLSALVVTAVSILQAGALWLVYRDSSGIGSGDVTGPETSAAANAAQGISLVVGQLAQMVLLGMLVFIVSRAVLGEDVTPHQAWTAVRAYLWKLVALSILVLLLMVVVLAVPVLLTVAVVLSPAPTAAVVVTAAVGFLTALPVVVWLWVRLGVASPALVLERTTIRGALRRSSRLVRRSWWRVFGVLLLSALLSSILSGIISLPFTALGAFLGGYDLTGGDTAPGVWFYVFSTIGSSIAGTLTYPFTAGVSALLYIDLRMRREALDITLVRAARAGGRA